MTGFPFVGGVLASYPHLGFQVQLIHQLPDQFLRHLPVLLHQLDSHSAVTVPMFAFGEDCLDFFFELLVLVRFGEPLRMVEIR